MTVVTNRKSADENVPFVRTGSSNQLYFCKSEAVKFTLSPYVVRVANVVFKEKKQF